MVFTSPSPDWYSRVGSKKKFLRSSVGESVRKREKQLAVLSPKRIHPSFASPSTRPLFPRSRSFVARNENKRDVLFRFIFSFRAERLGSVARARNAARFHPRASPRWKKFPSSKSAPTDARRRRRANDALSERTTLGTNAALFSSSSAPRAVRVRRVAECRAVSPCRPSYTRLVVSNRRFSRFASFSTRKQTRVEIATRARHARLVKRRTEPTRADPDRDGPHQGAARAPTRHVGV